MVTYVQVHSLALPFIRVGDTIRHFVLWFLNRKSLIPHGVDLEKWSGDGSSWCSKDRGTNPDPGLPGGGP